MVCTCRFFHVLAIVLSNIKFFQIIKKMFSSWFSHFFFKKFSFDKNFSPPLKDGILDKINIIPHILNMMVVCSYSLYRLCIDFLHNQNSECLSMYCSLAIYWVNELYWQNKRLNDGRSIEIRFIKIIKLISLGIDLM